ncbi:hypothetical protein [Peterkaempfera sp. SMS 1(5)a]|uniref:hypothetical protein n=1 Tax=Peterkaempfera podocarpi TaxID=3232308 RepID=UPI0036717A72
MRNMIRHHMLTVIFSSSALVALSACSAHVPSAMPSTPTSSASSSFPVLVDANNRAMPLDPYLLNPEQEKTISNANSALISQCMRSFGYNFVLASESGDPTGIGADAPSTRMDGYFGFQSMTHAQKWGYHPEGGYPAANGAPVQHQTSSERIALSGTADPQQKEGDGGQIINHRKVPDRGCVGEARRSLTGSASGNIGNPDFVVGLKFDTLTKGVKDPRTIAVFSKWSACMKKKGYDYIDPLEAAGDSSWSEGRLPTRQEIRVAVADQECRRVNNVVGVWFSVDYEYQRQAVRQNSSRLAAIKESMMSHLSAANRVLR